MRMTLSWRMRSMVPADAPQDMVTVNTSSSIANNAQPGRLRVVVFMPSTLPVVQRSRARMVRSEAQVSAGQQGQTVKLDQRTTLRRQCLCLPSGHFSDLTSVMQTLWFAIRPLNVCALPRHSDPLVQNAGGLP